jgi:negative regulator of sigma E activity
MSAFEGFDRYEALVAELRATPPVVPGRLRQRVLELAPSPRSRWSRRRRFALVVVPVAVALAVGAAVVYGLVDSGSRPSADAARRLGPVTPVPQAAQSKAPAHRAAAPATTTTLGQSALTGGQSLTIPKDRLVHADATLSVQVANRSALSQATSKATKIVASLGGYAQSVHYQSSRQGYGSASLALRVPVDRVQAAVARLGGLGTLLSQEISTQDLQHQLTQQSNQIATLHRSIAAYEKALQNPSLLESQRVILQVKLANAKRSVTQLRQARSGTIASAATADVSLTLTTKKQAVVPGSHQRGRFDRMLGSAAGFLGLEAIIVLYALVVLSPVLVLGGLAWALLRERRRRDEKRLLASA